MPNRTRIYRGYLVIIICHYNTATKWIEYTYQITLRGNKVFRAGWFWNKGLAVAGAHRVIDRIVNEAVAA